MRNHECAARNWFTLDVALCWIFLLLEPLHMQTRAGCCYSTPATLCCRCRLTIGFPVESEYPFRDMLKCTNRQAPHLLYIRSFMCSC